MLRIVLTCVLVLAMISSASADHPCSTWSTWEPEFTADTPEGTYYVFFHGLDGGPRWPWIYEESNGIDGLQRRDPLEDGTCHGMIEPDTLIF